jgi:hypothetical protein
MKKFNVSFLGKPGSGESGIRFLFDPWIRDPGRTTRIIFSRA